MKTMTVSAARAKLQMLVGLVNGEPEEVVEVVRHGKPVAVVMSERLYRAIFKIVEGVAEAGVKGKKDLSCQAAKNIVSRFRLREWL